MLCVDIVERGLFIAVFVIIIFIRIIIKVIVNSYICNIFNKIVSYFIQLVLCVVSI